ncbi:MAG: HAD-IA family hydrolase [Clostridia bacterium]|nr:HAD-IA family hydrolase [Clostridia bacterium]
MRYSVVLFDLDGTLLNTLDDLTDAVNVALKEQDLPVCTREEVRGYIGNGVATLLARAAKGKSGEVNAEKMLADFKRYYASHCQDETRPYDGVMELLLRLKAEGRKIGVVSNKVDFAVKGLCKTYFGNLIDVAIGENEEGGVRKKPAPDSVLEAMRILGVSPADTVYVGDSEVDIQTAKNADLDCISVLWGFKDREFLLENGASCLAEDVEELRRFL